jgi:hypothetical protein
MARKFALATTVLMGVIFLFGPAFAQVKWSAPMNEYPNRWYPTSPPPVYNPYGYYYPGYGYYPGAYSGYGRNNQAYRGVPQGAYSGNPYYYQYSQ